MPAINSQMIEKNYRYLVYATSQFKHFCKNLGPLGFCFPNWTNFPLFPVLFVELLSTTLSLQGVNVICLGKKKSGCQLTAFFFYSPGFKFF